MSHFIGVGILRIGLNQTDLSCWRLIAKSMVLFFITEFKSYAL